jgi:hypothetical protein
MSEFSHCSSGGQNGIRVSDEELNEFSNEIGSKYLDQFIPLPNLSTEEQKERMVSCKEHEDAEYWERDNGKHGWCCSDCGKVIQWG